MDPVGGVGHFVPWDGGCLLIGSNVGVVPLHAHYAIQIAFGSEPGLRFRTSDDEDWTAYGGAIIPSRQPHSMDGTQVRDNAVLFVEPETREGRVLTELFLKHGIASMPEHTLPQAAAVFSAWRERSSAAIKASVRRLISALTAGIEPSAVSDERILRAVACIKAHLDAPLTLEEVAAQAYLSPSRFRHVFVEQAVPIE